LAAALEQIGHSTRPATLLARVQAIWAEAVGEAIAAEAQPFSERTGTLTVTCRSAGWASELELLAPELLDKLNRALGEPGEAPLKSVRTRVGNRA
jgi:predicted nucleic acid-binding Zn ribbon protein